MTYIVIHQRVWMGEHGHGVSFSSDLDQFEDRVEALCHGWDQADSDDFNIGTLNATGSLVAFGFGDTDFGPDEYGDPHGGYDLAEIATELGITAEPA